MLLFNSLKVEHVVDLNPVYVFVRFRVIHCYTLAGVRDQTI